MALGALKDYLSKVLQMIVLTLTQAIASFRLCQLFKLLYVLKTTADRDLGWFDISDELLGSLGLSLVNPCQSEVLASDRYLVLALLGKNLNLRQLLKVHRQPARCET